MYATALSSPRFGLWQRLKETLRGIVLMAVTHATALRNVVADAIDNHINTTGAVDAGGDLVLRDGTTEVAIFPFQNPAFGAASNGVITLSGVPITVNAIAAGPGVDNGQIRDRANNVVINLSVTATGGGGDIELTNTNVALNQQCDLNGLTYTAPV